MSTPRQRGLADEAAALNAVTDPSQGGQDSLADLHTEAATLLAAVMDLSPLRFLTASGLQSQVDDLAGRIQARVGVNPLDVDDGDHHWFTPDQNAYAGGKLGDIAGNISQSFLMYLAIAVVAIVVIVVEVEK